MGREGEDASYFQQDYYPIFSPLIISYIPDTIDIIHPTLVLHTYHRRLYLRQVSLRLTILQLHYPIHYIIEIIHSTLGYSIFYKIVPTVH
jgi:hypothetical protein